MTKKNSNIPNNITGFETDPAELQTSTYAQINVPAKMIEIARSANDIIEQLSTLNLDKHVKSSLIVAPILEIEKLTLSSLYKQIVYHQHMIDQLMNQMDTNGSADIGMFFSISELSTRTSSLLSQFTIYIRSLPQYLSRLNNELTDRIPDETILIGSGENDVGAYAGTAATRGDEDLIAKLDMIHKNIANSHKDILDENLEDSVDFDFNEEPEE